MINGLVLATDIISSDLMVILIICIFSIMLGVVGVLSAPIVSVMGIILSISVVMVQVVNGSLDNALMLSISVTSVFISSLCFAVAWTRK